MIVSLFGPDGVGKSTVSTGLSQLGWFVFSGTNIASWPDRSWYEHFKSSGIDETKLDKDEHFVDKIRRVNVLARRLETSHDFVVIDSDPLHKTLMHTYIRSTEQDRNNSSLMTIRFDELRAAAQYKANENRLHVHFQISSTVSDHEQATILQERVSKRGQKHYFDPDNIEKSLRQIQACREMKSVLLDAGENVLTIDTDETTGVQSILEATTRLLERRTE
jgi:adenylate kinase family enzyme